MRYAAQAAATAASESLPSTSTSAIADPSSGGVRIVAAARTVTDQPAGAMKVLPPTVLRGVSAATRSGVTGVVVVAAGSAAGVVGLGGSTAPDGFDEAQPRMHSNDAREAQRSIDRRRMGRRIHPPRGQGPRRLRCGG